MSLNLIANITLDMLHPYASSTIVQVNQYDTAGSIKATLLNDGVSWNVPQGAKAVVMFKKTDNIGGFYDVTELNPESAAVTVDSNDRSIIYITLDQQTTTTATTAGQYVNMQVAFYQNGARLSTFAFHMQVAESVVTSGDIHSNWLFNILSQEIAQILTDATTPEFIENWLENNITQETGYVIDNSLTIEGAASDAKATGRMVTVSDTNPGVAANKVWVKKTPSEIVVPTEDEVEDLRNTLTKVVDEFGYTLYDELTEYTATQKRAYIYGHFKAGQRVKVYAEGTAVTTENAVILRYDDGSTQITALTNNGDAKELILANNSEFIIFLVNDSNITTSGTVIGHVDTNVKLDIEGIQEEVVSLDSYVKGKINTNNLATLYPLHENCYFDRSFISTGNYNCIGMIPVQSGIQYNFSFTARYVAFSTDKITFTSTQNVQNYTPASEGFMYVSYNKNDYSNPKIYKSTENGPILNYGDYYLAEDVYVKSIDKETQEEYVKKEPVLFVSSNSVTGYIESNGTINDAATSYKTTEYIPVLYGFKYRFTHFRKFLAFTDKNTSSVIPGSFVDVNTDNYDYTPSADGYVRFSYLSSNVGNVDVIRTALSISGRIEEGVGVSNTIKNEIAIYAGNILDGKKWWACGDSFTAWTTGSEYDQADYPNITGLSRYQTYPFWIGKRNPNFIVHNFAVSGQTMAMPADPGDFTNAFANDKYKSIPSDVDYITLYFGINDSHHRPGSSGGDREDNTGEIPLGTINDSTTATFYGAWNVVLEYLITNYPWAKIGIIVTNGAETEDYPTAEIQLAKKWGIPYLDLNGDYKLPLMLRCNGKTETSPTAVNIRKNQQWTDVAQGNGHPNINAHKFESTFIEAWLRSL